MKTPQAVIREALLKPVPCPNCSRETQCRCLVDRAYKLDEQAGIIAAALAEHGMLHDPQAPAADYETQVEEVAQFLARESRFVRYGEDGWRMLLDSDADVETAFAKARKATEGGDQETRDAIGRARTLLLGYIEERRAAKDGE